MRPTNTVRSLAYGLTASIVSLTGAGILGLNLAHAGGEYDSCRPVRVESGGNIGVGYPVSDTQIRTLDHLVGAKEKGVPIIASHDGTTAGQAAIQAPIQDRDGYADMITVDASGHGQTFKACPIGIAPAPGAAVTVLSFSMAADGAIHSHPAVVTEYGTMAQRFAEPAMMLEYTESNPEILSGAMVMAGDHLIGIVHDSSDPTIALVASSIEPALAIPGRSRIHFDGQTGVVNYEGLEIRPNEQANRAVWENLQAYVVARVARDARPALADLLGNPRNNTLFMRGFNGQAVRDLSGLLKLLASCPAAPAPACVPTEAWGTFLSEDNPASPVAGALLAVANLRFLIEKQLKMIPAELRDQSLDKLERITEMLRELDATAASDRATPEYKAKARAVLAFWRSDVDSLGGGLIFDLKQAALSTFNDFTSYTNAVREKLQAIR